MPDFFYRMLNLLRDNVQKKHIMISDDFKHDLKWFIPFIPVYNGVSFNYAPSRLACPSGLGAIFDSQVYVLALLQCWRGQNIAYTEFTNVLVALKVWHIQIE